MRHIQEIIEDKLERGFPIHHEYLCDRCKQSFSTNSEPQPGGELVCQECEFDAELY